MAALKKTSRNPNTRNLTETLPNQDAIAAILARAHFTTNFSRWVFLETIEEDRLIYISNCAPHGSRPSARDEQLSAIAEEAAEIGLVQVGRGAYPTKGTDAGYAVVVIFAPEEGHLDNLSPDEQVTELIELQADLGGICEDHFSWS